MIPIKCFEIGTEWKVDPFNGQYGWDNVKKGAKYYYTLIFEEPIPNGVDYFSMIDKGDYSGRRGFGFSNYRINNPKKNATIWNEYSIKKFAEQNNDGICGVYEEAGGNGYKLGCILENGSYKLIYLSGRTKLSWWSPGDQKAELRTTATEGLWKATWLMPNTSWDDDCYVSFDGLSMKAVVKGTEYFFVKMFPSLPSKNDRESNRSFEQWSGTGFALERGYIATNNHVVEGAKTIKVCGVNGNNGMEYNAKVVITDKKNDLAIIKMDDPRFEEFGYIPYNVKTSTADVGENIFVLGYPLTSTMGDEIKLTTGVISSRTGFQGDVSLYQISAPIQPGNSGGPLFDERGNLIGIVNAKHTGAENVGYAIKASYLDNLIESANISNILPHNSLTQYQGTLADKVKNIRDYVFMIRCSNQNKEINANNNTSQYADNGNSPQIIEFPYVERQMDTKIQIAKVVIALDYTAVEFLYTNGYAGGFYSWACINPPTYISANGVQHKMIKAEGIKVAPDKTYFNSVIQTRFTLYFPPIPKNTAYMDLIEPDESNWKFYGIKLK